MAAATMYVTPAGAGAKNGTNWANAFGLAEWETDVEASPEPGDIYYVLSGTYTLTGNFIAAANGTAQTVIQVIGVSDEALTPATGNDRFLIERGSYQFRFGGYWNVENVRVNGTSGIGLYVSTGLFRNCKVYSSTGDGFYLFIDARAIDCEAHTPGGEGFGLYIDARVLGCYAHDCDVGFKVDRDGVAVLDSIADTCATAGIDCGGRLATMLSRNTFYSCGVGILGTTAIMTVVMNNIIAKCTVGASWGTEQESNLFDYNNWYGNGNDVVNVTKGLNAMALDPEFVDAANGDFQIGQNLASRGFPREFPGGLSRSYLDVGAIQRLGLAIVSGLFTLIGTRR